ncbi:MAG: efflux RND transporter periplasmic adaptor subunit [Rikenellaceae bacterium]|nr:efflux RND transporter periplasmic adaptor subunit [Rikenellaceae bacterium]
MKKRIISIGLIFSGLISCGQPGRTSNHDHSHQEHGTHIHHHDHKQEEHSCSHEHPDHAKAVAVPAQTSTGEHGHTHNPVIELCPEMAHAAGITTAKAEFRSFSQIIPAIGEILPMPDDQVTVTAKTDGFVLLDSKRLLPGTLVGNGEKLIVVTSRGITEENYTQTVLQAEIALDHARKTYLRNQELYQERLITLAELQNSEAEYRAADLRYRNLGMDYEQDGLRVVSPAAGVIDEVLVAQGEFVTRGQTLLRISKNREVLLRADVSPQYLERLPQVISANFRTSASENYFSVDQLRGKVTSYGRSVDRSSRLVPVFFSLPYSPDYPAGSYAEVRLRTDADHLSLVLPTEAILEDFGHYFIYVASDQGYERRDIRIGGTDGIVTEVLSGLTENEEIVVTGATRLKLVERLGALGEDAAHAGHSH